VASPDGRSFQNVAPTPLKRVHVSTLPLAVWEGFDSDYAQASLDSGCGPGIAISPDGCFLAVSNKSEDPVTIYSLPSFNVVATIRHVDNGGPVMDIATSCVRFTQRNTLILCGKRPDNSSFYCIQEVTISGDVTRTLLEPFGEGTRPQALDVSESVIVVGTNRKDHQVIVLDASSGDVRAKFGVRGRKPGQLAGVAGIGITSDPQGVVIAENDNRRVSLFALNGDYLGSTNPGRIPHGMSDILVLDKHRYLACACFPAVLLVVELKSSSTVESFPVITDKSTPSCDHLGRHDGGESFMTDPFALAASHGFLFVLEQGYQRVQVYA
jgi:DNA-binding beta-propeller fold protein YncE